MLTAAPMPLEAQVAAKMPRPTNAQRNVAKDTLKGTRKVLQQSRKMTHGTHSR